MFYNVLNILKCAHFWTIEQNAKLVQQFNRPFKSLHTGPEGGSVYTHRRSLCDKRDVLAVHKRILVYWKHNVLKCVKHRKLCKG